MNEYRKQKGMTLLEVVVSMLIIGIAIIGSIAMIQTSVRFSQSANYDGTALYAAQEIIGKVRANVAAINSYVDRPRANVNVNPADCPTSGSCTPAEWAEYDLDQWFDELALILPDINDNETRITSRPGGSNGEFIVTIQWQSEALADRLNDAGDGTDVNTLSIPFSL